jgi:uncharacterized Ntn-hydrolase superfamily protein
LALRENDFGAFFVSFLSSRILVKAYCNMRHGCLILGGREELAKPYPSTFSLVARDPDNGDLGIIVQSKFPAVGALVPWASAGVGAVATQALANTSFGPSGLGFMLKGKSAAETLKLLLQHDDKELVEHRQVGIVDGKGHAAAYTGKKCMEWAGHIVGDGYSCQGNILAGESVVQAMVQAYETGSGDLIDRLFAALKAGQAKGGDKRGMQSAAILVVRKAGGYGGGTDRYLDVRVDEHPHPIEELERIFKIYDMTLLSREDPSRLVRIQGQVALQIQEALRTLGYLRSVSKEAFTPQAAEALQQFINVNNFENKARTDGTIWRSVLDYLLREARIPSR